MTPQKERIKQAETHEHLHALYCRMKKRDGLMSWAQAYAEYVKRTARQNRRAHKRNAS